MQPLIQRDCNYFSLRKVKEEAKYDVDGLCWRLPEVQLIKTNLPSLGQCLVVVFFCCKKHTLIQIKNVNILDRFKFSDSFRKIIINVLHNL